MSTSYSRGWKICFDGKLWRYCDNKKPLDDNKPCKRCGKEPTKEGYDACIGYIDGAISACCGHGISKKFVIMNDTNGK